MKLDQPARQGGLLRWQAANWLGSARLPGDSLNRITQGGASGVRSKTGMPRPLRLGGTSSRVAGSP